MKIMIFTEGTIIMHKNGLGFTQEEVVRQVIEKEPSVKSYDEYVPIGRASQKLKQWKDRGAEIVYITSRKGVEVEQVQEVLRRHDFPSGLLEYRKDGKEYKDVAMRVMPDILIEDDCESIGGTFEMIYPNIRSELRFKIKSIVVKEFEGIDRLSDDPQLL